MKIYLENDSVISGGDLISAIYRTDLVPIPVSLELSVKLTKENHNFLQANKKLWTVNETELVIVKAQIINTQSVKDGKRISAVHIIAVLSGCEPLIGVAKRATFLENTSVNQAYRALGAKVRLTNDIKLNQFICLKGQLPTERIALSLQKESAVIRHEQGKKISAIRLNELFKGESKLYDKSSVHWIDNPSLISHKNINYLSIDDDGSEIIGNVGQNSAVQYYPQADNRELQNLRRILITQGTMTRQYDEYLMAGKLIAISERNKPLVVLTSAHRYDSGALGGKAVMASKAWLAEISG